MLKFFTITFCIFTLFAAEEGLLENSVSWMRRSPAIRTRAQELNDLTYGDFAKKLSTMVICYHEKKCNITFKQIKRLISQNPNNANPYVARYDAHLISLVIRWGLSDIANEIVLNNQQSIHCLDKGGRTPLDEAIIFKKADVARYLHRLGSPQNKTTIQQYKTLCPTKKCRSENR